MELKQIEYFAACVQTGSFSKAAEILYTTQPSVSRTIKSLEEELGLSLFDRNIKGIALTQEGEKTYRFACEILRNVELMQAKEPTEHFETLHICVNPSSWFADRFLEYYQAHEGEHLHYEVTYADTQEMVRRVQNRIDDIGFVYVMKNQLSAFQFFLSRNYLEFEELAQTQVSLYPGRGSTLIEKTHHDADQGNCQIGSEAVREAMQDDPEDMFHDSDIESNETLNKLTTGESGELVFSRLKLVQRSPDEFSPDNYWDIEDRNGKKAAKAQPVVVTNSDYILNRLLDVSDLANISVGSLTGGAEDEGRPALHTGSTVLFGLVRRRGEDLPQQIVRFLAFLKNKLLFETK